MSRKKLCVGDEWILFLSPNVLFACAFLAVSLVIVGRLTTTSTKVDLDFQLLSYQDQPLNKGELDRALAWCSRIWDDEESKLAETHLERLDVDNGNAATTIANLMVRATEAHVRSTSASHSPPADKHAEALNAATRLLRRAAGLQNHHGAHYSLALLLKLYPTFVSEQGKDPARAGAAHLCASQRFSIENLDLRAKQRCSDLQLVYDWERGGSGGVALLESANRSEAGTTTPFVVQGMDAIVHNIPLTDEEKGASCRVYVGESGCYPALFRQFSSFARANGQRSMRFEKAALVDGFSASSYYHWLLEALPRLLILADDDETRRIPIFLPGLWSSKNFIEETLQLLPKSTFSFFEKNTLYFRDSHLTVVADTLYVPYVSSTSRKNQEEPFSQTYGSSRVLVPKREAVERIRNELFVKKETLDTLVLVVRGSRETRRLGNEHAIVAALATVANDHNLKLATFDGSNKTMSETRDIFGAARLVVGVHGAGLANVFVFCDLERSSLLELALPEPEFSEYRELSETFGFRYVASYLPHSTFEATVWPRPARIVSGAHALLSL